MTGPKEQIKKIVDDLTNLEINTIVRNGMTGGKMPHPRHALVEIAQQYAGELQRIMSQEPCKRDFSRAFTVGEKDKKELHYDPSTYLYTKPGSQDKPKYALPGSKDYFDVLRTVASDGLRNLQRMQQLSSKQQADVVMLYRIRNVSDQIKGVFNALRDRVNQTVDRKVKKAGQPRVDPKIIDSMNAASKHVADHRRQLNKCGGLSAQVDFSVAAWDNNYSREEIEQERPPFPLTVDELVTIRKAWEIGTEVVAMQTVIQLDGDVVTRVNPEYATAEKEDEIIRTIHSDSVKVSVGYWHQLVGLVKDFFENIIKVFLRK